MANSYTGYRPENEGWGAAATKAKRDAHGSIIIWNASNPERSGTGADGMGPAGTSLGPIPGHGDRTVSPTFNDGGGSSGGSPGGGGGWDPESNPYYNQYMSALRAMSTADKANTIAGIRQALIAFGLIPENFTDKLGSLDDTTKALIDKNTKTGISAYARMLEGLTDAKLQTINRLQARGLRRSGARGYALRRNQLGFDRNLSDAIGQLLGHTGSLYSGYANNELQRQLGLAQFLAQLFNTYYTPPPPSAPQAPPNTNTSSGYPAGGGAFLGVQAPRDSTFYDNYFNYGYRGDLLF